MAFKENRQFRLPDYDYSQSGAYFVTTCTKQKAPFFGEIAGERVSLSKIGNTARRFWLEIPQRFPNAELDEFIIMPDHVHGIILIREVNGAGCTSDGATKPDKSAGRHLIYQMRPAEESGVGTRLINQTPTNTRPGIENNPMTFRGISLGRIIRWFKGRTTYEIHRIGNHGFAWQRRFYDHVIRNEAELNKIRRYIRNNPLQQNVMDYPENLFSG